MLRTDAQALRDTIMNDADELRVATLKWDSGVLRGLSPGDAASFGRKRKAVLVVIGCATAVPDRSDFKAIQSASAAGIWYRSKRNPEPDDEYRLILLPWNQVTSVVLHPLTRPE